MDDSLSIGIREFKWLLLVLAALTFPLNSKEFLRYCKIHVFFGETWDGFPFRGTTLFADEARRELSHYDTPEGVYLLLSNPADGILPIERPLLHALSWSVIPQKVRSGCLSDVAGEDAVVSLFSSEEPDFTAAGLSHRGFHRISKDGGVGVWLSSTFSIGLILTHTFFSPNGLAVYGGKAKCLFESSGCSQDFFVCREWAHLQPAYPPGLALATLGMYGLAGMCGEYATQWMPMTIAVLVLFRRV